MERHGLPSLKVQVKGRATFTDFQLGDRERAMKPLDMMLKARLWGCRAVSYCGFRALRCATFERAAKGRTAAR